MAVFGNFFHKKQEQKRPQSDSIRPPAQWEHPKPIIQEEQESQRPPVDADRVRAVVRYAVLGAVGLLVVIAVSAYMARVLQQKPDPLAIAVLAPGSVLPGAVTQFTVTLTNQDATAALRDVSMIVKVDDGTIFSENPQFAAAQQSIPVISTRGKHQETFSVIPWGKQGDQRVLDVAVRYKFGADDTVYEKGAKASIGISADPVSLDLQTPDQVLPGQNFLFSLKYANVGAEDIKNASVSFDIPDGLHVLQTDPQMSVATTSMSLAIPSFAHGSGNVITAKSIVSDSEGQGKKVVAHFFVSLRNRPFEVGTADANLVVIASPLQLSLVMQGKPDYHANPGEYVTYEARFTNNYSYALKDVVVTADVSDPWFVPSSVRVRDGSYSSRNKLVTWNGGSSDQLLVVDPGKSGVVSFSVRLQDAFWGNLKNNTITVQGTISASNKPQQVGTPIASTAQLVTKVNGILTLDAPVYFRDPQQSFTNTGTATPRANQLNQYSVYFKVSTQGNDFHDIQVATVLPSNVSFEGKVKGATDGFVYNPRTNEVMWNIRNLGAYANTQLVFQVNFIPSVAQVGRTAPILDKVTLTGTDSFTGETLTSEQQAVFTDLPADPSVDEESGRIAP